MERKSQSLSLAFSIVLCLVGSVGYCLAQTPCTLDCTASASADSGALPLEITFSGSATSTDCVDQPSFSWDFGDGNTSTEQNPVHVYSNAGNYTWTLTVTADGVTCMQTGTISAASFDLTILDDHGRAFACVNSKTGDWSYTVMEGQNQGTFTGEGNIRWRSGIFELTAPSGVPWMLNLRWYTQFDAAYGSFIYYAYRVRSSINDANVNNNPNVCR